MAIGMGGVFGADGGGSLMPRSRLDHRPLSVSLESDQAYLVDWLADMDNDGPAPYVRELLDIGIAVARALAWPDRRETICDEIARDHATLITAMAYAPKRHSPQ